jgi:hypothetical protein
MRARGFIVQKACEQAVDCQDRFSIRAETGSAAVCDGMSQSFFPKYWAEILADRYTADDAWYPSPENVAALAPLWREKVNERLARFHAAGIDPWRAESMLSEGRSAGSTLVGLRVDGERWRCDVLGDSCLVVVAGDQIEEICSSMDTGRFDNYPDYFDSDPEKPGKGEVTTFSGMLAGKTLFLVSDPLAGYLSALRGTARESLCIRELLAVGSADEFEILVDYWRKAGMHNDDTTMVVLTDEYGLDDGVFKRQEEWIW